MDKKSFEELLDGLNNEERKKFEYILNFYTEEHVFYNFEHYRHALKDFNLIRYESFNRPLEERYKRVANAIEFKNICENFENFRTYFGLSSNKDVTDFLIYLTSYTNVRRETTYKVIKNAPKYKELVESGAISEEDIFNIIVRAYDRFSKFDLDVDLARANILINTEISEQVVGKVDHMVLEESFAETDITHRIVQLSQPVLDRLSKENMREAYAFQGNVETKDKSILVIKAIMKDRFKTLDDKLLERLKSMLRGFNLSKITEKELQLFEENLDDIIERGYDIEDIFFVRNIKANSAALKAFSSLPDNLQRQVLKVNVVAKKREIANVLSALTECREKPKTNVTYENVERMLYKLPQDKRKELRDAIKTQNENGYKLDLGLDKKISMGFEIEAQGLSADLAKRIQEDKDLYSTLKSKQNLSEGFGRWKIDYDGTVPEGLELISPVLYDKEKDWQSLEEVCNTLKSLGAKIDSSCGGHIHIGSDYLGSDENAWKNLFKIWQNAEEFIYKMSSQSGEPLRKEVLYQASPVKPIIDEMFKNDTIKINSRADVVKVADNYTRKYIQGYSSSGRTKSMNLQCIAEGKQNTIEFRIPNGSIDPVEIQNTANLYARIVQVSKMLSENSEYKKDVLDKFLNSNNTEEKLACFLDLVFDKIEDKLFFYDRYFSQEEKLTLSGKRYDDITDSEVDENKTERYEWRGYR